MGSPWARMSDWRGGMVTCAYAKGHETMAREAAAGGDGRALPEDEGVVKMDQHHERRGLAYLYCSVCRSSRGVRLDAMRRA